MPTALPVRSKAKLDTSAVNLEVFYEELPDRYQSLFPSKYGSFTTFTTLPLELRLMIWRLSMPRQRKIWLHARRNGGKTSSFNLPILPLAHTCRESRLESHRHLGNDPDAEEPVPICVTELDVTRPGVPSAGNGNCRRQVLER
ncbi:hypothetical protein B2J93_4728 [Marssonina coronariae]|uniref:2EXR domain-containing protein n=1 Tax=Diplocarpon coronariae TaxID=2795749 RepID=A0A218Z1Q1_9HELO|nr:hypothetical protein B2J93_4728 [Marssonina coronariae]